MSLQEHVARAIYHAAFTEADRKYATPSPGWCWEKTSENMRAFAMRQAAAAIVAMQTYKQGGKNGSV